MCENYEVMKLQTWIEHIDPDEINLDKLEEYISFIEESINQYDPSRYSEVHHIMPSCLDQSYTYDNEKVRINGSDHFRAHMKLVECFNGIKKRNLAYALNMMKSRIRIESISPEEYEKSKKLVSEAQMGINNPAYGGKCFNEESRRKISLSNSGSNNYFYGKHLTGELNGMYGKTHSEESRKRMSDMKQGKNNPCYGKVWITNGLETKYINKDDPLPDGWRYGRTRIIRSDI